MNKIIRMFAGSFLALILVFGLFPIQVRAAERVYDVAIRAGSGGSFNVSAVQALYPEAKVDEGYIKFPVKRGETLETYFASDDALNTFLSNQNILKTESVEGGSYMALAVEPIVDTPITRNTDIVINYGRVVNPARYVVQYVNGETDADLAAPIFGLGEAGDTKSFTPLIISGYNIAATPQSVTLEAGKTALLIFRYSPNESIVYNTEVIYTEGETVYNDIINRIGQAFAVDVGAGAGAGADAGAGENLVAVEEEETPLANNTLEDNGLVELEENETPLSNQTLGNTKLFAIIAGFAVLLAIGVAATLKIKKNAK